MDELNLRKAPSSMDAEKSVLGGIFLDSKIFDIVNRSIKKEDFYFPAHSKIYGCISELVRDGKPLDIITVREKLENYSLLDSVGGITYLVELMSCVPTTANTQHYVDIVLTKSKLRQMIAVANEIIDDCYTRQDELNSIIDNAEKKVLSVGRAEATKPFKAINDVVVSTFNKIEELHNCKGNVTGLPTGYKDLDEITAGFQKNDLIIVAARPSVGKTAFALNIAQSVAKQPENYGVAIFSLEMGAEQLAMRLLSAEGNINAQKMRTGNLNDSDWKNLTMSTATLSNKNIFIDDSAGIRIDEICSKCRQLKQENKLDLVVIDYLQLIQGNKKENRQQEVTDISRKLKSLARELEVPIIALSQLSRGVELRQDKRPIMSDIRESGSIEQDADVVAFLYREDYYDKETEEKNIIEIIIAKQRNGPVGDVKLGFVKEFNKFVDL